MTTYDFIVVGSGATGSMAAKTLVDAGATVLMLDGGYRDDRYEALIPPENFTDIRHTDPSQHRYFLGDDFESAQYAELTAGAQLTPPRQFVVAEVARLLKIRSNGFTPVESLALGGLGGAWGLHCCVFSDPELERASLPRDEMHAAYQVVADRIGISAASDDAHHYTTSHLEGVQPSIPLDPTCAAVLGRYERTRPAMHRAGFHLGRPALALLTRNKDDRHATQLRDMDFYANAERAAWRPALLIEELSRAPKFAYVGNALVTRFEEAESGVTVVALDTTTLEERRFVCRRLVLAPGVLGTARIALRSIGGPGARLPLLCNAYTYVPCIVPGRVGRSMPERNTGLLQLVLFHDADGHNRDVAVATMFSYRSLLLFRLLREIPLGMRDARVLMNYLLSGFLIVGIDHPQEYSAGKELSLEGDPSSPTGDRLAIDYALTDDEHRLYDARERTYTSGLRRLGAWPLKRVHPPYGSSIHYAGTLPFTEREKPYTISPDGRLRGTRNVYVADGSGFTFLPAKGLTLSLMAQAHLVAAALVRTHSN
jgi:choline dehydrogenase-like flavoprotein